MSDIYGGSTRLFSRAPDAPPPAPPPPTHDDPAALTPARPPPRLALARPGGAPVAPSFDRAARRQLLLKRVLLDIPMSALALLVLSPLLLVIAAAIRFSSRGPIIFRQTRVGLDGADFTLFKFRTIAEKRGD